MIYLLFGTDTKKSREKLHQMLEVLKSKRPNSEIFRLTAENWQEPQFDELLGARGLFDQKYIVVLDFLFEKKDVKDYVLERLEEMKTAEHPFLMIEGKIDQPTVKKLEKVSEKVQEFSLPEREKKADIFSVTGGILSRDKKRLWISCVDLISKGVAAEEIHGIIFWQLKNMILAAKSKDMKGTGLSPFQYKAAQNGAKKYSEEELLKMSGSLVEMTRKVRSGKGDLEVMLEKWILQV